MTAATAIESAPGVLAVQVDYDSGQATIGVAEGVEVPKQEILAALKLIEYSGVFLEDEQNSESQTEDDDLSFHQHSLLERFDSDKNGELDEPERVALRHHFGDIDVPMLPDKPFDYITVHLPKHVNPDAVESSDNTPDDNRITNAGALLGRVLFYDKQLSANNSIACASCHLQEAAFADLKRFSDGFEGGKTERNAMSLANLRYSNLQGHKSGFFWDERAETLEEQVLIPIQDRVEMGMMLEELEERVAGLPYYPRLIEDAFGTSEASSSRVAKAISQFLRSMVSLNSKFDRAAAGSDDYSSPFTKFSELENHGKSLFMDGVDGITEHGCAHCHIPPTFGMTKAQNNGLATNYEDKGLGALNRPVNDPFTPSNDGKFKASSLRNIELTAPYMHDGRFETLIEVIDHYSDMVHPHQNLMLAFAGQESASSLSGLNYSEEQKTALIAFLKTLTDEKFVTDMRYSDPFVRITPSEK